MHAEDGMSITTKRVLGTRRKKTCAQETGERKTPQKKSRQRTGYRWWLFQWITTIPIESAPIYAPVVVFCQSFGGDLTGHTTLRKGYVGIYTAGDTHVSDVVVRAGGRLVGPLT